MRHIFRVASLAGSILLAVSLVTTANAEPVDDFWGRVTDPENPHRMEVGQTIRVVFVTSATIDGNGTTQSDYDSFGDGSVSSGLITGGLGLTADDWQPLVSTTENIDKSGESWSRTNPVQGWVEDNSAPVFNTVGQRVASSGSAMLGGSVALDNAIRYDESGDDQTVGSQAAAAWTGTDSEGRAAWHRTGDQPVDLTLGSENASGTGFDDDPIAIIGNIADSGSDWLESTVTFRQTGEVTLPGSSTTEGEIVSRPIYVMSGEVTVVPEPSTVLLWLGCSGLAGLIYWRKRRRS